MALELARMASEASNIQLVAIAFVVVCVVLIILILFGGRVLHMLLQMIKNDAEQIRMSREAIENANEIDTAQLETLKGMNTSLTDNNTLMNHFSDQLNVISSAVQAMQGQFAQVMNEGERRHGDTRQFFLDEFKRTTAEMLSAFGHQQSVMHGIVPGFPDTGDPRWRDYIAKPSRGEEHPVRLVPVPRFGVSPIAALNPKGEKVRAIVDQALYNGWIALEQIEGERRMWGWVEKNSIVLEPVADEQPEGKVQEEAHG